MAAPLSSSPVGPLPRHAYGHTPPRATCHGEERAGRKARLGHGLFDRCREEDCRVTALPVLHARVREFQLHHVARHRRERHVAHAVAAHRVLELPDGVHPRGGWALPKHQPRGHASHKGRPSARRTAPGVARGAGIPRGSGCAGRTRAWRLLDMTCAACTATEGFSATLSTRLGIGAASRAVDRAWPHVGMSAAGFAPPRATGSRWRAARLASMGCVAWKGERLPDANAHARKF